VAAAVRDMDDLVAEQGIADLVIRGPPVLGYIEASSREPCRKSRP